MSEEVTGALPSLISLMVSVDVKPHVLLLLLSRLGSPSALLSLLFKTCGLWTLSCDSAHTMNETLKWLTQLPTL